MSGQNRRDPGKVLVSVGRINAAGTGVDGPFYDFIPLAGLDLKPRPQTLQSQGLTGARLESEPAPPSFNYDGLSVPVEFEPEAGLPFLLATIGAFETNVLEAGVAFEHLLFEGAAIDYGLCLVVRHSLDGQTSTVLRPVAVSELVLSWSGNNAFVERTVTVAAEREDYVGDGAIDAGTPPVIPHVQGIPTSTELADQTLTIEVTDVTDIAQGRVQVKAATGAAALGATGQNLDEGHRLRLNHPDGHRMGEPGLYLEVLIEDVSGLSVGDRWVFPLSRPAWTPVIPARVPLTASMVQVTVAGQAFNVDQGTITITPPLEYNPRNGSRFADGALNPTGQTTWRFNLQKVSEDDSVLRRLLAHSPATFEARFESPKLIPGSTSHYFEVDVISRNALPADGTDPGTLSQTSVSETLVLSGHESSDPTYPMPTIRVVNSIADPLA